MKYSLNLVYIATLNGDNLISIKSKIKNQKNIFILILTVENLKIGFSFEKKQHMIMIHFYSNLKVIILKNMKLRKMKLHFLKKIIL